jgi:hypothetical protein
MHTGKSMTDSTVPEPHDGPRCGARKRQPRNPGETCAQPAGWGTGHLGFGRCKLHGGATPYKHGRYSRHWKLRAYSMRQLRTTLTVLIPDPDRRDELLRMLAAETGLEEGMACDG